jgi:hypothetical protein
LAWTRPRARTALAALCGVSFLGGCASPPVAPYAQSAPPVALATIEDAGVRDLRAPYRAAACARVPPGGRVCDDLLLRLPGEGPSAVPDAGADLPLRYRVAFVPGLFSECFDRFARPFGDAQRALREEGFAVDYFQVPGRGTTAENARRLADHFAALDGDARPIILFVYSKGLPDALEFVVRYPESAARNERQPARRSPQCGVPRLGRRLSAAGLQRRVGRRDPRSAARRPARVVARKPARDEDAGVRAGRGAAARSRLARHGRDLPPACPD